MPMKRGIYIFFLWCVGCSLSVAALEVESVAGALRDMVGDGTDSRELVVSGTMDVRDFEFVSQEMASLRHLDLGAVAVAHYDGEPSLSGRTLSAAGVLPECALMCPWLETVVLPRGIVEIADGALGGSGIVSVTIPDGVRKIGDSAFGNCSRLEEVVIPGSAVSLGRNLFKGCVALRKAVVENGVAALPAGMFAGCVALTDVALPAGLLTIGEGAFAGCGSLAHLDFPGALTDIADRAFACSGLESADMEHCVSLVRIGNWAFASSPKLAWIALGSAVSELGDGAFFNDSLLEPGTLSASVASIGDFALAGWEHAREISLPASLEYLGCGAMANWASLERISAEAVADVPELGDGVWRGVAQERVALMVPEELADAYRGAAQWQEFDIMAAVSGGTGTSDAHVPAEWVRGRFEGDMLVLEVTDADNAIASLLISDPQGRSVAIRFPEPQPRATVDIPAWNSPVLLLRIILADGTAPVLKLRR